MRATPRTAHAAVSSRSRSAGSSREVGAVSNIDYDETVLRWLDRHVRDSANGVESEAPVRIFVMGDNRWREAHEWPVSGVKPETLFLRAGGQGPGAKLLSRSRPTVPRSSSSFVSDPAKPVNDPYAERSGAHDYREFASRRDVLTFETPPLESDTEVIGAIEASPQVSG